MMDLEQLSKEIPTPWGEIGYVVFKRTYARRLKEDDPDSPTEEFWQVVKRELEACKKQLKVGFTPEEELQYAKYRLGLKFSTAGRFMWQLGTKTVDRLGLPSLQNCSYVTINTPIRPFTWAFEMLMLGSGVGFNIQKENVYQLPKLKGKIKIERKDTNDADFIVPDTREGWVKLLGKVLKAHFYSGEGFSYSTVCVRGKGAPIKGFGGTASGPEDLCWGMIEIHKILNSRANKKLRPIDCLDIMNIIGFIVVSGNVRRSAQIAIGDHDDVEYLKAKRWDLGKIPNWRSMSNNSIYAPKDIDNLPQEFWDTYEQGEPYGLINLELSKSCGRTGETKYPDPDVEGFNPCKPLYSTILTDKGYITFEQALKEDSLKVLGIDGQWKNASKPFKTGENRTITRLTLSNGSYLYGTDNHLHMDVKGEWKRMDEMEVGDQLSWANTSIYNSFSIDNEEDYKLGTFAGWVQGDGWFSKRKDNIGHNVGLCFGVNEADVVSYFEGMLNIKTKPHEQKPNTCSYFSSHRKDLADKLVEIGMPVDKIDLKWLYGKSKSFKIGFIKGIFTADGSVRKANNVELYSVNREVLEVLANILNEFGIHNTITVHNNGSSYIAKDGKVRNNSICFKINIYAGQFKKIGFLSKFKNDLLEKQKERPIYRYKDYVTIVDVEREYSVEDVYDITVEDETHAFYDTGVVTHNCAEQSLSNFETCCLSEVYLPNIESFEELIDVLKYTYRVNKHSLALHCSLKETEDIVHKNMRMGIGMTGILQASPEQRSWLNEAYIELRQYDAYYSDLKGFPRSIKLTTVKPSGCQRHDTLLITDKGILQLDEIGDVNGEQWQEHDVTISQENSQEKSTKFYVNGLSSTKKILMSSGLEIESTENHQYRVLEEGDYVWKTAEDISVGDIIPFKLGGYISDAVIPLKHIEHRTTTNIKKIKQPNELNSDLAWLLGLYFGDGSTHKKGIRIAGDINKRYILERAASIIKDQFELDCIIYDRTSNKNNSDLYVNSQELLDFLRLNDLIKQKSRDLEFPLSIRQSGKQIIESFIDGYAHADGSFKTNGLSFCTTSKKWATQLVVILRAIGKDAKMRLMPPTESSKGENMRYWVSVRKGKDVEKRYISKEKREIWEQLEVLGLDNFSYDVVVSVEDGLTETYDIEVPNNNCYIANSYVSHNTLSLLAGVTPGVHPNPAGPYYYRRVRMAAGSPLVDMCKDHGYHVEPAVEFDGSNSKTTMVVTFPCKIPESVPVESNFTYTQQLNIVRRMQKEWSDNSVSCTIYYKKEDIPGIKEYLKEHFTNEMKTVSFLLSQGHGFKQAPYETITKEQYELDVVNVKPITSININEDSFEIVDCAGGACPVK